MIKYRKCGVSAAMTFHILGDEMTLQLFKHITGQGNKPSTTKKQYYSRMEQLREIGLIERIAPHQYAITNLGKVMERMINIVERALNIKWGLTTLDALELANKREEIKDITPEQWDELIGNLIKDETIKNMILDTTKRELTT